MITDIQFNDDGTKLFFIGNFSTSSAKYLYELSASGTVYQSTYSSTTSEFLRSGNYFPSFNFVLDGTGIVINDVIPGGVDKYLIYELTTAYDLTTFQAASDSLLDQIDLPGYDTQQSNTQFYVSNNAKEVYYFEDTSADLLLSRKRSIAPKFKMVALQR